MLNKSTAYKDVSDAIYKHVYTHWTAKQTVPIQAENKFTLAGSTERDPTKFKRFLRLGIIFPSRNELEIGTTEVINGSVVGNFFTRSNEGLKDTYPYIDDLSVLFSRSFILTTYNCNDIMYHIRTRPIQLNTVGTEEDSNMFNMAYTVPFTCYVN